MHLYCRQIKFFSSLLPLSISTSTEYMSYPVFSIRNRNTGICQIQSAVNRKQNKKDTKIQRYTSSVHQNCVYLSYLC